MSALHVKEDSYMARDNPLLSTIINGGDQTGLGSSISTAQTNLMVDSSGIEHDVFNLVKKEMDYDQKCVRVWWAKMQNHEAAVAHQKDAWRHEVFKHSKNAAGVYMKTVSSMHVYAEQNPSMHVIAAYKEFKRHIETKLQMDPGSVVTVALANWAAPCLVPVPQQLAQFHFLNFLVADSESNVGLSISPTFAYKKGTVWMLDHALMKSISESGGASLDRMYHVLFTDKGDQRDQRPMVYSGRVITMAGKDGGEVWKKSRLLMEGRTEPARQLPAKDMDMVENTVASTLPQTTDDGAYPSGAHKFAQPWAQLL
jgi:hypothetical protein